MSLVRRAQSDFNSTKVQFGGPVAVRIDIRSCDFNSTKVQFGEWQDVTQWVEVLISIPLRYNLEIKQVLIDRREEYFNSTKVQFGDVKVRSKAICN